LWGLRLRTVGIWLQRGRSYQHHRRTVWRRRPRAGWTLVLVLPIRGLFPDAGPVSFISVLGW